VQLVASDPDGDVVVLSPVGSLPTNALLDSVGSRLVFRPAFDQAGSISVAIEASDGEATTSVEIPIEVTDRVPTIGTADLVLDRVQTPTLQTRTTISGNVVGDTSGPQEPLPFVAISGLSPSNGRQGRDGRRDPDGPQYGVRDRPVRRGFRRGDHRRAADRLLPDLGAGAHPDRAQRRPRNPLVGGQRRGLGPGRFVGPRLRRRAGGLVFSGRLIDSFTQQPLVGARVSVDGTLLEAETDADGRFSIEGVPPGARQVVVLRNDYDVERLDLVFESGTDLALEQDVPLDALARPFQAGGSLPRAANLVSVLDRGVGAIEQTLTQEQAEALIEDTLLVVGGRHVGVFDEAAASSIRS
jgi:hypothetical protein